MERSSQTLLSVADHPPLPGADELRRAELELIHGVMMRMRAGLLFFAAIFVTAVVLSDPVRWKIVGLGVALTLLLGISLYDLLRARRRLPRRLGSIPIDVLLGALGQTCVIWLTGGLESPWLVVYLPLAVFAGVVLPSTATRIWLGLTISALLWLMAIAGLAGWTPRATPPFLHLEPGFARNTTYVLFVAGTMQVIIALTIFAGTLLGRLFARTLAQAIAARQERLEELAAGNRELSSLSSAIAHELKNPLASIHGLVQLLGRGEQRDERDEKRLEVLAREVDRLRFTLDEFLAFSRPLGELSRSSVDVAALLDELTHLHEPLLAARRCSLVRASQESSPLLDADPRKLKQALINLLQNALQAAPAGSTLRWIAEVAEVGGVSVLRLGVEDEGPGIPEAVREQMLELGVTTKEEGSGIGLPVARGIARQHGGELRLESGERGGCRAMLELPLRAASNDDEEASA